MTTMDPVTAALVERAPTMNHWSLRSLLRTSTPADGERRTCTLDPAFTQANAVVEAWFETRDRGERVTSRMTFRSGAEWRDDALTTRAMPMTIMMGMVGEDLGRITGIPMFAGLPIVEIVDAQDTMRIIVRLPAGTSVEAVLGDLGHHI